MSLGEVSVDRRFVGDRQERACLPRERLVILEQRPVSGVRVRQQDGVGQVLDEAIGVDDRDHLVMDAVDDKRRMSDGSDFRETLSGDAFPITERRHLRIGDRRSRNSVEVLLPLGQSLDERRSSRLAARSQREEDLLENAVALVRWILQMLSRASAFRGA